LEQRTKAPLAIVGVVWRSQTGGIPRLRLGTSYL